ncbi:glycoside hydrolase family 3 protein [Streptococcus catagoni]|uniref:glycoside hydrolase family 3 protein n=1 Tax=Streptococcus catagoni TaxID=2654874 RepID=UPI001408EB57|nr:glycoside hydrolase family 3 protein [Streptococcus catagoni]
MPKLVDLKAKPYQLTDSQVSWVEKTLAGLSVEEKIGQLFINLFFFGEDAFSGNHLTNKEILEKYHIGGARYMNGSPEQVQGLLNDLQENSKVPLLIAANCDSGGDGAVKGGTYIASGAQSEASRDTWVPYHAGLVSAREATALGVNVNFDPCVDILQNWRNTIVNTRAYGTNAEDVITYSNAYLDGLTSERNIIQCIKHFPGDGTEERDQHLVLGVNEMQPEEWEKSFGRVYRNHIDRGVEMIMAGHIALPYYQQVLNPQLKDEDILPATLSPELINNLLKTTLNFNGLVITDASHMLGMTSAMRREDYVPQAIAAGCDMFLFFNNMEEDFHFMLKGYEKGIISEERLNDAVRRILGLKAKLNLHEKQAKGTLLKNKEELEIIGCKEHLIWQKEAAQRSMTLLKDSQENLPISPRTHKRIRLYYLEGEKDGIQSANNRVIEDIKSALERRGYEVDINDGSTRVKGETLKYREQVDLALTIANVIGYGAQNNYRIQWKTAMSNEVPWYVHEVPTVFVSLNYTTHLHDVTMVKTAINAYHHNKNTIESLLDCLEGKTVFAGQANDLVWANKWQAKL